MQMFSSSYYDYSNPFPNFPSSSSSSSYPTLPFLIDPENVNDFSNTLLDDPLSLPFIPSTTTTHDSLSFHVQNQIQNEDDAANLADCTAVFEQDASNSYASAIAAAAAAAVNYGGNNSIPNYLTQKPAIAKKDRHSKIHTSQGLRDRRVRLSSDVARKFFDLQDMLEFDKPSNTLEWLFTKSENAIKELARSKNNNNNNNNSCTEKDEVVDSNNNKSLTTAYGDGSKGGKLKWTQRGSEDGFCVQSKKESRERARARARERTCYKRVQDFEENIRCPATATTQMLQQVMMSSPIQNVQPYPPSQSHLLLDSEIQRDHHGYNVIEESIMIKRNTMSSQTHHHQNLASFNNIDNIDYPLLPYSTPSWDPNGFSNFCGLATMNLSTCFMNQWY